MGVDKFLQSIDDLLKGAPVWVRCVFAFLILALVAVVVYFKVIPPKPVNASADFTTAFDREAHDTSGKELAARMDFLMQVARSDSDRCQVGFLYLDLADKVSAPHMPASLAFFIENGSRSGAECIAALKVAASTAQSKIVVAAASPSTDAAAASHPSPVHVETAAKSGAATQILQVATTVGARGWMYLGEQPAGASTLTASRTIVESAVPVQGDTVTTSGNVNLRDTEDPRKRRGEQKGVITKGSRVTLTGPTVAIDHKAKDGTIVAFVWAPVSLDARALIPGVLVATPMPQGPAPTPTPSSTAEVAIVGGVQSGTGPGRFPMFGGSVTFSTIRSAARPGAPEQTVVVVHNETQHNVFVRLDPNHNCEPKAYIVAPADPPGSSGNDYHCTDPSGMLTTFAWSAVAKN